MLSRLINRFLFLILCGLFLPRLVFAARLEPPIIEETIKPGSTISGTIRLQNDDPIPTHYGVDIQRFSAEDEDGHQHFFPLNDHSDPVDWIRFAPIERALVPGEGIVVPWRVTVPASARPGGYTAVAFFSSVAADSASVGVHARVGVLFLLHVSGTVLSSATMETCEIDGSTPMLYAFGVSLLDRFPSRFLVRVRNDGDDILTPNANVMIRDSLSHSAWTVAANPSRARALPHSLRRFFATWNAPERLVPFGRFSYLCTNSSSSTPGPDLTSEQIFWIVPWKLFLIVLLGGGVLIFTITRYTRGRRV